MGQWGFSWDLGKFYQLALLPVGGVPKLRPMGGRFRAVASWGSVVFALLFFFAVGCAKKKEPAAKISRGSATRRVFGAADATLAQGRDLHPWRISENIGIFERDRKRLEP
ncbi:MAG: hypothetical protein LBS68_00765 [Puniceicoccales bacterium]|jgi:hypothetical protein|nr:hypothetical protein [Puniceicoccales bacterium]